MTPAPDRSTQPPNTDHDDCQIFVLLGRSLLDWDHTPPDRSQFPIFYRPAGGGYVEQCPWSKLGVRPLPLGDPDPNARRFFTQPEYADGGRTARVKFVTVLQAHEPSGRPRPPFISQINIELAKETGQWRITKRLQGPIT